MDKVLVFSPCYSERFAYVLECFSRILELDFCYTNSFEDFKNAEDIVRINYSKVQFDNVLQISPIDLLFEHDVNLQTIECKEWNKLPCFFITNFDNEIPFDIFAATFYLTTRYEEYTATRKDEHGRFCCEDSVAYQNKFLHRPIVDLWAFELLKRIKPDHEIKREFGFLPTIDVDTFYKYRRKGILGSLFLLVKSLLEKDFKGITERLDVILGKQEDPYFNFEQIVDLHREFDFTPLFFFHMGGNGRFDKKMLFPTKSKSYKRIIYKISKISNVGLHLSYKAAFSLKRIRKEKYNLEKIIRHSISKNRFHFLRFRLPESYQLLIENDIKEDYSMLYANEIGFRAGTSFPYMYFDLQKNRKLPLKIYPTAMMDATLLRKKNEGFENLSILTTSMLNDVKYTKGCFVTLFHNEHLVKEEILYFYKSLLKQVNNTI